jgi:hypothetical protein
MNELKQRELCNQPINQSINQSEIDVVTELFDCNQGSQNAQGNELKRESFAINQPTNQSINQSINQSFRDCCCDGAFFYIYYYYSYYYYYYYYFIHAHCPKFRPVARPRERATGSAMRGTRGSTFPTRPARLWQWQWQVAVAVAVWQCGSIGLGAGCRAF